jgi:hypothetical protein
MKRNLLKTLSISSLLLPLSLGFSLAQQATIGSSYAFDGFESSSNLITYSSGSKITITKKEEEGGYLECKFAELNGATTGDFISFTLAQPINLSNFEDRKTVAYMTADQDVTFWVAISNVPWGPYQQYQRNQNGFIFSLDEQPIKFQNVFEMSDPIGEGFDPTKVSSIYIILNPTYVPPTFTTGTLIPAGTLKIYSIEIGNNLLNLADGTVSAIGPKVIFNSVKNKLEYSHMQAGTNTINLFDNMGKLLSTDVVSNENGTIEIPNIQTGIYNVQIVNNLGKTSQRLMIK